MAEPIEQFLRSAGINYRLIRLSQEAFTVDDVIKYAEEPVNANEVCKTIILRGKKSNRKFGIFLRGGGKIDFSAAKKLFGEEMAIATPDEVIESAGVEPGAVCPFLLSVPLYVDPDVLTLTRINCGSGDHLFGLEFATEDLAKAVNYKTAILAKVPPMIG